MTSLSRARKFDIIMVRLFGCFFAHNVGRGGWTTPVTAEEVDGDGTAAPRRNNTQAKSEINFNDAGAESTINKHSYGCRPLSVLFCSPRSGPFNHR